MTSAHDDLLQLAITDNVHWCSAICNARGADDDLTVSPWINLKTYPRYYPNIITRGPGEQAQVCKAIELLRSLCIPKGWGIKDSFADLELEDLGFETVIYGSWFGGIPNAPQKPPEHWKKAQSINELRSWKAAWGEESDVHTLPDALLNDSRIEFWFRFENNVLEAGFICFRTEFSVGLSNWFSPQNQSIFDMGALDVVSANFPGVPIVFWSTSDSNVQPPDTIERLAPLKVWISKV